MRETEMFDVVDEEGNPTGEVTERETAHEQGILHRTSHVWIVREKDGNLQVLLQKRSAGKDSFPGCYDISSAGHIPAGADFLSSALRELKEELGYEAQPEQLVYCGRKRHRYECVFYGKPFRDNQISNIYLLRLDLEPERFVLQSEEVTEVRWFDFEECLRDIEEKRIPNCVDLNELQLVFRQAKKEIYGDVEKEIRSKLFALQDLEYREFNSKLIPTVPADQVIGVRTPALRVLAKELAKRAEAKAFLKCLPHTYFEENNLHAFLIESMKDYETCIDAVNEFLPYVDNWATCDQMAPKVLKKHLPELLQQIYGWLESGRTYTVRYAIGMLMRFYLDEAFKPEYLELVAKIRSEEYYVKMMVAWYFATALAKQYEYAVPYLEQNRLDPWTHNKTIQKAVESYRISEENKRELRLLRVKK